MLIIILNTSCSMRSLKAFQNRHEIITISNWIENANKKTTRTHYGKNDVMSCNLRKLKVVTLKNIYIRTKIISRSCKGIKNLFHFQELNTPSMYCAIIIQVLRRLLSFLEFVNFN